MLEIMVLVTTEHDMTLSPVVERAVVKTDVVGPVYK